MPSRRIEILRLLDELEGPIARGFREAVAAMTNRARIDALAAALEAGDIERAMTAAGYRAGSWSYLTESIRNGYIEAGVFTIAADVPKRFGMEFDINNPRAESWLRNHSSELVTRINDEQRDSIRDVLEAGMSAGRNPRNVALDIVGRVNKATQRREGGIIGLNGPQTNAVINAREDLNNLDSNYFTRARRDRRFDSIVRKAIKDNKPLSQTDIDRIVGRYSDRLLKLRGDTIGRTEALSGLNEAADEAIRQVVDEGLAPPDAVKRIWDSAGDSLTRESHIAMEGQPRGLDEPFKTGNGALMMHPGDTSRGAGPDEIINCRCVVRHDIDFIAVELAA